MQNKKEAIPPQDSEPVVQSKMAAKASPKNEQKDRMIVRDAPASERSVRTSIERSPSESRTAPLIEAEVRLPAYTEQEWLEGTPAYNSTLLNVKKGTEQPLVFAAPEIRRTVEVMEPLQASKSKSKTAADINVDAIAALVSEIARTVIEDKANNAEIEVLVRFGKKTC
ncbi:unnamed protein product, partial [Mesorhabditis spiculigera]